MFCLWSCSTPPKPTTGNGCRGYRPPGHRRLLVNLKRVELRGRSTLCVDLYETFLSVCVCVSHRRLCVCVSCPQAWLQQYGYLPSVDPRMSVLRSARVMQSAIAAMQRRYGLNVTGTLDSTTVE